MTEEQIDSLINAVGEALHELPDTLVGAEPAYLDTTLMARKSRTVAGLKTFSIPLRVKSH